MSGEPPAGNSLNFPPGGSMCLVNTNTAKTINLPTPDTGRVVHIVDSTGGANLFPITILPSGADVTIRNGYNTITQPFGTLSFLANNNNWYAIVNESGIDDLKTLNASNINAGVISTNFGFFSTISTGSVFGKHIGDGSLLTAIPNNGAVLAVSNLVTTNTTNITTVSNLLNSVSTNVTTVSTNLNTVSNTAGTNATNITTISNRTNYLLTVSNYSAITMSTSFGFFSTISSGSIYGKHIGDGSLLTGLPAAGVGVTSTLSTLVFLTSSISSANVTSAQGYISSLTVDSLTFGLSNSYISMGDVIATSISSVQTFTSSLTTTNLQVGNVSSLSYIAFPGLQLGYNQTVIAEQSTGTGLQELLVFRGSSASDRIRMQTTGTIVFEPGVSARIFPSASSNVTPAMIINASSNVGIGIAVPTVALDVAGTGRFQILSTQQLFVSTISSGAVFGRFVGDGSGLTGVSGGGGGTVSTFTTIGVQFSTVSLSSLFLMRTGVSSVSFGTNTSSLGQVYIGDLKNQLNFSTARDATLLVEQQLPMSNTFVSTFTATGFFNVPQNVNFLNVHMWGSGGSNGGGGGGAYISGTLPVSSGSILRIAVNAGFGNSGTAAGGGYAGIFLSTIAVNNILAIAGGGGASGSRTSDSGGFGGILQGGSGGYGGVGQGGTSGGGQTANTNFHGYQLQGDAGNVGGGGGFWGGQGGYNNSVVVVGGGGGSSYISNLLNFYGENGTSAIGGGLGGGKGTPFNNGTYGNAATLGAVVLVWSPGLRRANLMTIQDAFSRRLIVSESLYMGINVSTPNSNLSLEVAGIASLSSIITANISTTSLTIPYGAINAAAVTSSLGVFGMRTISNGTQIAFGTTGALGSVTPFGPVGKNSQIYINDIKNYLGNVSTSDAVMLIEQDMSLLSNTNVRVIQISTSVGYTVPAGVTAIRAFMWGGGGANYSGSGGAGAFVAGTFNVNPGDILSTVVNYGGGGGSITGGGLSGIFRGAISQGNAVGIAAGGGAGSSHPIGGGGYGGVLTGGPAYYRWSASGGGGTQTAGGTGNTNGSALQGGGNITGGGGGYFGGAGNGNNSVDVVGGGGGSSYIAGLFNVLAEDGERGNFAANNLAGGQWAPFASNWGNPTIGGRIFMVYNTRVRQTNLLELRTGYTSSITAITNFNTMGINVSSVLSSITLDVGGQGRFITLSSQQLFVSSISSGNLFGRFIGDGSLLTGVPVTLPTTLPALLVSTGFLTASNISSFSLSTVNGYISNLIAGSASATTISTSYGFFSTISSGIIYGQYIGDGSLLTNISNTGAVLTISNSLVTTSNNLTTVSNLLNAVSTNVTTVSTNLNTVSNTGATNATNITTVSNTAGTNATNITTISNLLNSVSTNVTNVSTNLNTLSNNVTTISNTGATNATNITTVSNTAGTNTTNITTISNLLNSVSTNVTTVSTNLNTLSNNVTTISNTGATNATNITTVSNTAGTNATNITTISNLLNSVSTNVITVSTNLNTLSNNVTTISNTGSTNATNITTVSNTAGTNATNITTISNRTNYLLTVSNYSAITMSTSFGFFSTISTGSIYGRHIGDGSLLTGLPAGGLTILPPIMSTTVMSSGIITGNLVSTARLSTTLGYISSLTVDSLSFGLGNGFINMGDVITTSMSSIQTFTSSLLTTNLQVGIASTLSYIAFPGLQLGYNQTVIAEQSIGTGLQELLLFKGSTNTDRIRMQTTGTIVFEPGVSARVFPSASSNATPAMIITTSSNVGIGILAPTVALDVAGTGRFQILSTQQMFVSSISSGAVFGRFVGDGSQLTGLPAAGLTSLPPILSTNFLSTGFLSASNISAFTMSTNFGFFSTISAGSVYSRFIGDGSLLTAIPNTGAVLAVSNLVTTNATNITTISNLLNSVSTNVTTVSTNLNTLSNNVTTISNTGATNATNITTVSNSVNYLLTVSNYSAITISTSFGFFSTISTGSVYGRHIGDGSLLTNLTFSVPSVLSTNTLSTGFLSASNISAISMSTNFGFFSTISTGTVFGRHIGDGSGLTGITTTSTFTTVTTTSLTVTSGAGTINFTGGSNTSAYGTGVDTLSLRSQLNAYGGGIASLFFGNATAGYPLARIYAVDSVTAAPGASALVFQTAVSSLNASLSGVNILSYTGTDQSYTVPSGVTSVTISMWSGGGGSGQTGTAGAAGFWINGILAVTAGQVYKVIVAQGGVYNSTATSYGGGGGAGSGGGGASGGGRSALQLQVSAVITSATHSGSVITYTTSSSHGLVTGYGVTVANINATFNKSGIITYISATQFSIVNSATAGSVSSVSGLIYLEVVNVGGGGGSYQGSGDGPPGAGGLTTGGNGQAPYNGQGGTQSAGGTPGTYSVPNGSYGEFLLGGASVNHGGGGGGGWFGGGGGDNYGGGGGGSSYTSFPNFTLSQSGFPGNTDTYYVSGLGAAGTGNGVNGGNGRVAIAAAPSFVMTEAMRISSNAFVGIGMSNPSTMLDVAGSIRGSNLQIGTVSSLSYLAFPGLRQQYSQTALAEVSTGTGLQEMLVFRGSSASDRIRMQTTGSIIFETGVGARVFPAAPSNVTPAMVINTSSNVGIGIAAPTVTLDVAGAGRFQTLSTQQIHASSFVGGVVSVATVYATTVSSVAGFFSTISTGTVFGRHIGDGSGLTNLIIAGVTSTLSTLVFLTSSISTANITSQQGYISSLTVDYLAIGSNVGYVNMGDIIATSLSSIAIETQTLTTSNLKVGTVSSLSYIAFSGLQQGYAQSVVAEQSTGTGLQELLVFRGSSASDRIRMQTTGSIVFEPGVSARVYPAVPSNVTPAMIITTGSNVGIGIAAPGVSLDVAGAGRFTAVSTNIVSTNQINSSNICNAGFISNNGILSNITAAAFFQNTSNTGTLGVAGITTLATVTITALSNSGNFSNAGFISNNGILSNITAAAFFQNTSNTGTLGVTGVATFASNITQSGGTTILAGLSVNTISTNSIIANNISTASLVAYEGFFSTLGSEFTYSQEAYFSTINPENLFTSQIYGQYGENIGINNAVNYQGNGIDMGGGNISNVNSLSTNTISSGTVYGIFIGDGSGLTGLPAAGTGVTNNLSTLAFYTSSISSATIQTSNILIGTISSQSFLAYPGLQQGYAQTVIAEQSTGTGLQELLIFRGSSASDRIRMQTTGFICFETGVGARTFPSVGSNATPSWMIDVNGCVGVGLIPSGTASRLDVAGQGRFQNLSTTSIQAGSINLSVAFV